MENEETLIHKIISIINILSSILFLILFILLKNKKSSFTQRNLVYLTICEIFLMISTLLHLNSDDDALCLMQAILVNFFQTFKIIFSVLTSYSTIVSVISSKELEFKYCKYRILFLLISLTFSILSSLYIYYSDLYGSNGMYCYIPIDESEKRIFTMKNLIIFLAMKIVFIFITFFCVFRGKNLIHLLRNKGGRIEAINRAAFNFCEAIAVCNLITCISDIYKIVYYGETTLGIEIINILFGSSGGIIYLAIFVKNYKKYKLA